MCLTCQCVCGIILLIKFIWEVFSMDELEKVNSAEEVSEIEKKEEVGAI